MITDKSWSKCLRAGKECNTNQYLCDGMFAEGIDCTKKGKAKPMPEGWTEKDEQDLTFLVDEIFSGCGPQAVADTRLACEKAEKVR